jgi:hypothetical protein
MVLNEITYYPIFGIPLITYGGIATLILLLVTAGMQLSNKKGITKIPFVWHQRLAALTVVSGLFHGIFALLAYV